MTIDNSSSESSIDISKGGIRNSSAAVAVATASITRIPDAKYWRLLRKCYFQCKKKQNKKKNSESGYDDDDDDDDGNDDDDDDDDDDDEKYDNDLREFLCEAGPCGSLLPSDNWEIRTDGPYGRGIFIKRRTVPKGTAVWDTEFAGRFVSQHQWETFMGSLPHHMQCDAVEWAYTYRAKQPRPHNNNDNNNEDDDGDDDVKNLKKKMTSHEIHNNRLMVYLDLEPQTMINHGGRDIPQEGWTNCRPRKRCGCDEGTRYR